MTVDERLAKNAFTPDSAEHIVPNQELCRDCEGRPCVTCCPGQLYEYVEEAAEIKIELSGCLECGTCMLVCPLGALDWRYPGGGCGVRYRFG